jgi:NADH:ubiquinone oxidoreductase subunit 2 (subunit N)
MRTLRAILSFYSSFAFVGFLLTAFCLGTLYVTGLAMFVFLFWLKVGTMWLIYIFTDNSKRNEYYYYDNLGISKRTLWIPALALDFIVFMTSMVVLMLNMNGAQTGG